MLQFTKNFCGQHMLLAFEKSINGSKSIFHECDKKILEYFAKRKFKCVQKCQK